MFTFIRNIVEANKKTLKNNVGATMIEYALVVAAIVAVAAVYFGNGTSNGSLGGAIDGKLNGVVTKLGS